MRSPKLRVLRLGLDVAGNERVDPEKQIDNQRRLIANETLGKDAVHNAAFAATPPGPFSLTNHIFEANQTPRTPETELPPDPLNAYPKPCPPL